MISRNEISCVLTTHCRYADQMMVSCDCMGWFSMQKGAADQWTAALRLPPGRYRIRYYARYGPLIIWRGNDELIVEDGLMIETQAEDHPHEMDAPA